MTAMPQNGGDDMEALLQRFNAVLDKLSHLEQTVGVTPSNALHQRQHAILDRLAKLEQACGLGSQAAAAAAAADGSAPSQPSTAAAAAAAVPPPLQQQPAPAAANPEAHPSLSDPAASAVQKRLATELLARGIPAHRFVRCPPEYYDQTLEFRRGVLGAPSVAHLCKALIMENTRAHPSITDWTNPRNSKYYVILVQYAARLNAEKLKSFVHKMNVGKFGKKFFNMRLAPEAISDELSGFSHNAVSPIGIKTPLPIIMSHKIAELQPDFFFLGAGEVDLKVGLSAADFIAAYHPFVVDCTYEEGEGGGAGEEDGAEGGQD